MIDNLFEEIDRERQVRAKELLRLLSLYGGVKDDALKDVVSKSVIVLSYAHWEGFYNRCVECYLSYLVSTNKKVVDVSWLALIGCINSGFDSMKDKNHSLPSKVALMRRIRDVDKFRFDVFDKKFVMSQSNLNFERLKSNLEILDIDEAKFLPFRLRIDKELVGWRHSVAHGDNPNLNDMDARKHITFCNSLLLSISDVFQSKALEVFTPST